MWPTAHRRLERSALALVSLCACTRVSDAQRFEPNPETLLIERTVPEPDAVDLPADAQIDLCLSEAVDPRSVGDLDARLSSGPSRFDSRLEVQLFAWRGPGGAPIERDSDAPWCDGSVLSIQPRSELEGGVLYRVRLAATVVGWAGESFDTEAPGWTHEEPGGPFFFLEFTVARTPATRDPPPDRDAEGPDLFELFEDGEVFATDRALCSCHQQPNTLAHALLDLSSPATAFAGLTLPGRIRDTGFPMVTPRRPSESFLIHKLLRTGDGERLHGLLGDAMPPQEPIPYADLVRVAEWIAAGAEL